MHDTHSERQLLKHLAGVSAEEDVIDDGTSPVWRLFPSSSHALGKTQVFPAASKALLDLPGPSSLQPNAVSPLHGASTLACTPSPPSLALPFAFTYLDHSFLHCHECHCLALKELLALQLSWASLTTPSKSVPASTPNHHARSYT